MERHRIVVFAVFVALFAFVSWRDSGVHELLDTTVEADPAHEVVLYTTSWCGYCAQAREFLTRNAVPFVDHDIERDDAARAEYERRGGMGVPVFVIDGRHVVHGLDLARVIEILEQRRAPVTAGT